GSTDATPQEAINHVHENAAAAIKTMLEDEVSLLLVDYDVDAEDRVSELILLRAPDLEKGEELIVKFNARNRMGGGFRRQDIGKARIERVDSEYAYAEITEGRGEITEAIHEDPYRVIVLPGGDG
ncbi:MAG: hypothetical protein R3304_07975, partial [Longimicrobiales bacterium]|nr:hypothetical protein [Longimicrobiales bacterium]